MNEIVVGLISDTHGLLRPEAIRALRDCDLLIHAGDIGGPAVVAQLRALAPTFAIRGNVDNASWAEAFPETEIVEVGARQIYVLHDIARLGLDPVAAGFAAVVSGHSHRAAIESRKGVLYINPGSAGPRRFRLPVTVALARAADDGIHGEIVELDV